jgi:hypothetical protein
MRKIIVITVIILWLMPSTVFGAFGVIGQKANYADAWPTIEYETDTPIAVGVHDQRPYVINGEKSPTYVGNLRSLFGNPWNVNTQSDKPLSEDIASAVVSGFMNAGIQATSVPILFSDDPHVAIGKLKQLGAKRIIFITIREFRSDTYRDNFLSINRIGFFTDAILLVYDGDGKELANSTVSHKNIGSGDGTVKSTDHAVRSYLNMLLNDPPIKAALGAKPVSMIREIGRDGHFIAYNSGTVLDTKTNLMWAQMDNGRDINWVDAKSYCENYRGGGYTDWRMPTQNELEGLYGYGNYRSSKCGSDKTYEFRLTELIRLSCVAPWASDRRESQTAYFHFSEGGRYWDYPSNDDRFRALPVRSVK